MAIKNLLVAYDDGRSAQNALDVALVMQDKFDTHITGLLVQGRPRVANQMSGWLPEAVKSAVLESEKKVYDGVAAKWAKTVEGRCVPDKTHWIRATGVADGTVMAYARYFDMTIMGQFDRTLEDIPMVSHPDLIALQSGRPVMVVPRDFDREPVNDHVVLAWDGRRAAARAMADALHFLEHMIRVTILTVGEPNPAEAKLKIDVATHLSRHGVETEAVKLKTARRSHEAVGAAIVDFCQSKRPDVLVMGAYEHSKFREDHFGGVTNTVFREATIPVFMSH